MQILIPKGFFENKNSVNQAELLKMVVDMVQQIQKIEEDSNYNLEWAREQAQINQSLKQENRELKDNLLKKEIEIIKLQEELKNKRGISA